MRALIASLVLGLAVACGGDDSEHNHPAGDVDTTCTGTTSVSIKNFAFVPACVNIAAGQSVTFTNDDATSHTATTNASQSAEFDSGVLAPHAVFTSPPIASGSVKGHCNIHPSMAFTINVQ